MPNHCDNCFHCLTEADEFERSGFCVACVSRDPAVRADAQRVRRAMEAELGPLFAEWRGGDITDATVAATMLPLSELALFIKLCQRTIETERKLSNAARMSIRMMRQALDERRTIERVQAFFAPQSMGAAA